MIQIGKLDVAKIKALVRRKPDRLGIESEGSFVRIVRLTRGADGRSTVAAFGEIDLDIRRADTAGRQRLRAAISELGGGNVRVAMNVDHPSLRIRRMVFPKMPDRDLREAIRWNFREHIEGKIENYIVGSTPLPAAEGDKKVAVMAYCVSAEAIREETALLKALGLKPVSLEPAATALLAAFHANGILDDGKYHCCVAFGDRSTHFLVMQANSLIFSRPLPGVTNEALVKIIVRNMGIEEREAKRLLATYAASKELTAEPPRSASAATSKPPAAPMPMRADPSVLAEGASDAAAPVAAPARPDPSALADHGPVVTTPEGPIGGIAKDAASDHRRLETTLGHYLSQLVIEVQRSLDAFFVMDNVERVDSIHICGMISCPGIVPHMRKTLGIETRIFNPFEWLMENERRTKVVNEQAPLFAVATGLAIP